MSTPIHAYEELSGQELELVRELWEGTVPLVSTLAHWNSLC